MDMRPQASFILSTHLVPCVFKPFCLLTSHFHLCTRKYLSMDKQQADILYGFISFLHKEFTTTASTTSCCRLPEDTCHLLTLSSVENTKAAGVMTPLCPVNSWNLGSQALQAQVRSHQQIQVNGGFLLTTGSCF